ncbi:hemerythrin domain-containing protein [Thermogymnomonas acidicola]|uniref:hemerythrin domain-containing protein n=1 Tax=Thermogymnomonas acidicola TaxID=399579 RepID=UPI00094632BF|nr:hemerythrin domain-containing protein [Thermogymnomonas acidicola]
MGGRDRHRPVRKDIRRLRRHIYAEEEDMFPRALQARPDLSAKVSGLEMEHASIWMLLDRVEGEIRRNEVVKAPQVRAGDLRHPAGPQRAGGERCVPSGRHGPPLASFRVPDGWVCRKLRRPASTGTEAETPPSPSCHLSTFVSLSGLSGFRPPLDWARRMA